MKVNKKKPKFLGKLRLTEEQKKELVSAWYFYYIIQNKLSFYKKFSDKIILCNYKETKLKYDNGEAISESIFKARQLNKREKQQLRPFDRETKYNFSLNLNSQPLY